MSSAPRRQTYGRSPTLAWRAASPDSTQGNSRGSDEATNVYSRGECGKYVWVPTGGVAPLYWRFLGRLVSALENSGISSSSMWEKSTIDRMMELISPSETSCIASSLLMCPLRSCVLADLVVNVSAELT